MVLEHVLEGCRMLVTYYSFLFIFLKIIGHFLIGNILKDFKNSEIIFWTF